MECVRDLGVQTGGPTHEVPDGVDPLDLILLEGKRPQDAAICASVGPARHP